MHASRRQKKARARPFSPPTTSQQQHPHLQAQPAYKVAKLVRGQQGFGFTISGQAPCILSCVVPHSSADRAGLHTGDCLLAVNGCDVSRAPHDEVVRLVGSCMGTLRLHLAESGIPTTPNGYSSSDDASDTKLRTSSSGKSRPAQRNRHPNRMKRKGMTPPSRAERVVRDIQSGMMATTSSSSHHHPALAPPHPLLSPVNGGTGGKPRRRRRHSSDSSRENIACLMASPSLHVRTSKSNGLLNASGIGGGDATGQLMYRSVVGYLGTIEMPEDSGGSSQSSPGSTGGAGPGGLGSSSGSAAARLAAIRSCVRRLRVEKKVHTLVLLRVWGPRPGATAAVGGAGAAHALSGSSSGKITLTSPAGANLARFPARRVVFCGAYADDARFFGLVTSASTGRGGGNNGDSSDSSEDDEDDGPASASDPEAARMLHTRKNSGFTSCHVFMVDSRLVAHEGHAARAHAFRFQCTPDAAAVVDANAALGGSDGRCLEFPPTAEPILQAVLSLCNSSGCHSSSAIGSGLMGWASPLLQQQQQHHQQQHQHNLSSHSSSSSSSSNSDSGIFRDRDDSGKLSDRDVIQNHHQQLMMQRAPHPHNQQQQQNHHQHRQQPVPMNRDLDRLTVRAMPVKSPGEVEHAARLRSSMQRYLRTQQQLRPSQISTSTSNSSVQAASMLLLNRNTGTHQHGPSTASGITTSASAINPSLSVRATMTLEEKLSPQVYKGGIAGVRPSLSSNSRPIRTPSERSRARSLDDLSKSGSPSLRHHHLGTSPPSSEDHHHYSPHYNYRVMGSDNGLDRIDWDDHHEYSRPSFHTTGSWHHSLASTSSKTMRDDEDDDDHSREEVVGPRIQQQLHHHHHLHEKNHVQQLENINEKASQPPQQPQQQHAWTQGFEKLLEDPLGLRAFAEFLKKEFSHENIYFWAACERFHRLFPTPSGDPMSDEALQHDDATTRLEAQKIFERHLGPTASEPVNVDSQARQMAEDHLNQPGPELFDQAQKQVFNLMKYDCYPRFLRSVIYRQCVEALESHRPPPVPEPTLSDPDLNIDYNCGPGSSLGDGDNDSLNRNMALKKSESDAGERRRRSLLPWPKKDRSKSKDRGEIEYRKTNKKKNRLGSTGSSNCADKDKENGTDCDDDSQQQRQQTALMMKRAASRDSVASEFSDRAFHIQSNASSIPLVKVLLPDLSSAVIAARPGQSVQQLLNKLLDRRGLKFSAFELYDQHASTAIELERDASMLAGLEVRLEPRSVFHLLLVSSGKSLMIRGQPRRQLGEVLKPILIKYGLKMEQSVIVKAVTGETVPSKTLLAALDGFHLKVSDRDGYGENPDQEDSSAHLQDEPTEIKNACSSRESNSGSLLGRNRGLVRRNSLQATERSRTISAKKSGNTTTIRHHGDSSHSFSASASSKRLSLHDLSSKSGGSPTAHLMPPPRAPLGSRKLISTRNPLSRLENEALYERLKRAQRSRLEDQRGTEINTELPDFLKLPGGGGGDGSAGAGSYSGESHEIPIDGRASEPILGCRPRLVYQSYEIPLDGRASEPIFSRREVVSEPYGSRGSILSGLSAALSGSCTSPDFAAIAAQILDKSFSADGLLPTHEQAEKYFSGPSPAGTLDLKSSKTNNSNGMLNQPTTKITVAAAKQTVATVAARIAAIEQNDRMLHGANRQASKSGSNSNWDDLLLDLDVDWRCYQGRSETDDQKQQQQHQHSRPRISSSSTQPLQQQQQQQPISCRPPLPVPPQQQVSHSHAHLEMLDLDDPLVATGSTVTAPPPLPPKPGKAKLSDAFKAPSAHQPVPPPRPPSRNVNTVSRVNVSFV